MRSLIAILSLVALMACTKKVMIPTGSEAPPIGKQCDAIAAENHYTPEQRAKLCDCYEPEEAWWRYVLCGPEEDTCNIPDAEAPGWHYFSPRNHPHEMMDYVEAAKARVGERCGESPMNTLGLLADELLKMGVCAAGPWRDALIVVVEGEDPSLRKIHEEFHSVAFTDGCWYGPSYKGAWYFSG